MTASSPAKRAEQPHRVVMLAYRDAQILDITGPLEVFARTSRWLTDQGVRRRPAYQIELVADRAGPVRTSGGLQLVAARSYRSLRRVDTLLVTGGIGAEAAARDERLLRWLRTQAERVPRIGSVCTGALVLAAAGLLDGRRSTTHWAWCDRLAAAAPRTRLEPDALFIRDGRIYTSAGVTAGMDMALAIVEEDWGRATALAIAQELVMFVKRPGGQSQFSRQLEAQRRDDPCGALQLYILANLTADLRVPRLAERIGMSPRHFAREFVSRTGVTPGAYVARVRLDQARQRLEEGGGSLKQVARRCGFGDEQTMRRTFRRALGVTPQQYRARFAG